MWKRKKTQPPLPNDAQLLFGMAKAEKDPARKHEILSRAARLAPDDLPIQREILMLGELYRRDGKRPNMRLIKFYLFHAFEQPETHSEAEQKEMARELFDAPQLRLCLSLARDPDAFFNEYLQDLAASYIDVFIAGSARHNPSFFGIPLSRRVETYWAMPAADIIRNLFLSPFLSQEEARRAAVAFYKAFSRAVRGQTAALDENLGAEICALLA